MNRTAPTPARRPLTPDALPLAKALGHSEPLARLQERLAASRARFDAIRPLLPDGLAAHVAPGPLDGDAWCLLAANGAVAAKLRQSVPRFEQRLLERGFPATAVRIKASTGR